jgi:hypothetical protein
MLRHVALVRTDVSVERSASFRVTRIGEPETTPAITSNRRTLRINVILHIVRRLLVIPDVPSSLILVTLMMEALHSSEILVLIRTTRRNIAETAFFVWGN